MQILAFISSLNCDYKYYALINNTTMDNDFTYIVFCHNSFSCFLTSMKIFQALYTKKHTNKNIFEIFLLYVAECISVMLQCRVFPAPNSANIHTQLCFKTCCLLGNSEPIITCQFSSPASLCHSFYKGVAYIFLLALWQDQLLLTFVWPIYVKTSAHYLTDTG